MPDIWTPGGNVTLINQGKGNLFEMKPIVGLLSVPNCVGIWSAANPANTELPWAFGTHMSRMENLADPGKPLLQKLPLSGVSSVNTTDDTFVAQAGYHKIPVIIESAGGDAPLGQGTNSSNLNFLRQISTSGGNAVYSMHPGVTDVDNNAAKRDLSTTGSGALNMFLQVNGSVGPGTAVDTLLNKRVLFYETSASNARHLGCKNLFPKNTPGNNTFILAMHYRTMAAATTHFMLGKPLNTALIGTRLWWNGVTFGTNSSGYASPNEQDAGVWKTLWFAYRDGDGASRSPHIMVCHDGQHFMHPGPNQLAWIETNLLSQNFGFQAYPGYQLNSSHSVNDFFFGTKAYNSSLNVEPALISGIGRVSGYIAYEGWEDIPISAWADRIKLLDPYLRAL
jgi:hypothetical protein